MAKVNNQPKVDSTTTEDKSSLADKTTQNVVEDVVKKETAKAPEDFGELSRTARQDVEEAKELVQLVVFELDKEEYAVEISEVREILRMPDVTPMPNTPDFIQGVINVRGKIVVVIDLEERFNLQREAEKKSLHVLLSEIGSNTFGATVDEVTEVLRVPKDSIEEAPAIIAEKIQADYVRGIVVLENRLLIMLDFAKVFEEKGLAELGEIVKKQSKTAQARRASEKPEEGKETEFERKAKVEKMVKERLGKREGKELEKEEGAEVEKKTEVEKQEESGGEE